MCAILNVEDTSRLKIVGIYTGSVLIQAFWNKPKVKKLVRKMKTKLKFRKWRNCTVSLLPSTMMAPLTKNSKMTVLML